MYCVTNIMILLATKYSQEKRKTTQKTHVLSLNFAGMRHHCYLESHSKTVHTAKMTLQQLHNPQRRKDRWESEDDKQFRN